MLKFPTNSQTHLPCAWSPTILHICLVIAMTNKNSAPQQIRPNVMDVASHVTHYKNMIKELQDEVGRLKEKISDDKHDCPGTMTQGEIEINQKNTEKLRAIKNELLENFREQMFLRCVCVLPAIVGKMEEWFSLSAKKWIFILWA